MSKLKLKKSFNNLKSKKIKYFYSSITYLCLNFFKFSDFFFKKKYLDFYNFRYFFLDKKKISKIHPNYLLIYFKDLKFLFNFLKYNSDFLDGVSYGLIIYNLNLYNLKFFRESFVNHGGNNTSFTYFFVNFLKTKIIFFRLIYIIQYLILNKFFLIKIKNLYFLKLLVFCKKKDQII